MRFASQRLCQPALFVRAPCFRFSADQSDSDFQAKSKLSVSDDQLNEAFTKWIAENDVVVFMKGTKKMPQCGFSRFVVVLMQTYGIKEFKDVNVLADEQVRN